MENFSKILKVFAVVVLVVAAGLAFGWLATRGTSNQQPPPGPTVQNTNLPHTAPRINRTPEIPILNTNSGVEISPVMMAANTLTNWEDKLDEILGSESDDTNKVHELFEMFPRLPEEGQVEIAQHLSNLVEDEDYAPLGKLKQNATLSEDVLDILMADLLNRPNTIKLPMFLELAKNHDHPSAEEAKDLLELYLDEDYGTDWNKWREKVTEWLKENPDD